MSHQAPRHRLRPLHRAYARRLTLAVVLALPALLSRTSPAFACTPPPDYKPATIAERTRRADFVLVGDVTATSEPSEPLMTYSATIHVARLLKGDLGGATDIEVAGYGPSGLCFSELRAGITALLFVDGDAPDSLRAHYTQQIDAVASATGDNVFEALAALGLAGRVWVPWAMHP